MYIIAEIKVKICSYTVHNFIDRYVL